MELCPSLNYIADRIFGLYESKFWIQKQLYYDVKGIFGLLSQSVIRAISKVVEVYKRDRKIKPTFRELGAIRYDQRNSSINIDKVSITTLEKQKRLEIKIDVGEYQKSRFDKVKGQCDLIRKHGVFYIIVTRNVSEKPEYSHKGILGIDLGVNNIAVDNDREVFDSKKIEEIRHRYSKLRSNLQRVGTKSAKRKLKKVSGKERRFKKDIDHCITNRIISKAKGTIRAIALENRNNIRSKVTVRREQRKHSKWTFGEIRQFLEYKAKREGVPLNMVNPKDTSRECPKCHHTYKENRKKNKFECIKCGYIEMADYVAAINIAARASVNEPHSSTSFYGSYKPRGFSTG